MKHFFVALATASAASAFAMEPMHRHEAQGQSQTKSELPAPAVLEVQPALDPVFLGSSRRNDFGRARSRIATFVKFTAARMSIKPMVISLNRPLTRS